MLQPTAPASPIQGVIKSWIVASPEATAKAPRPLCIKMKSGASGEIRTLKHLFLRQAAIPIRARWHMVHRGGFEPPRPTRGDRVTAGPFRPGSRTCANLAEGRRIERPSLITTPWFSGPVADHSAVPSAMAESAGVEPASLLREPLFSRQVPYRPAHSPLNCQRTTEFW